MNNSFFLAPPSGEFDFRFQQIRAGGFLIASWGKKIPENTIVCTVSYAPRLDTGKLGCQTKILSICGRVSINQLRLYYQLKTMNQGSRFVACFPEMNYSSGRLLLMLQADGVTEDWCKEACLGDCLCAAAIF
ncbi:hypothetical protein CK203_103699 [Vitis vinifera]|uniref:Uncharacterized protein n=1 Tax=Vitis vinifera TaxID=29760 RepID=A0A438ELQ0_VITVI|nr:hypothetical protein CK203_103699 [Vitis vinifera]